MITIFTPTFNRAHLLKRVAASIQRQKFVDYEWLIVDDGSTDNTTEVIQLLQKENSELNINYIQKSNGGKHSAINKGVQLAKGELFLILDSDDWLADHALINIWKSYLSNKSQNIGGILGLAADQNQKIIGTPFPENSYLDSFSNLYYQRNIKGDKSVAFITEVLKKFPFPEPENIRFVSELVVWHPLSEAYPMVCLNEITEYKEYLQGGLSNSDYQVWYWKSLAFTNYYLIANDIHPWDKYPAIRKSEYLHLAINSLLANDNYWAQLPTLKDKWNYIKVVPRALFSYINIKRHVAKNNK